MTKNSNIELVNLGWNDERQNQLEAYNKENNVSFYVGRVGIEYRGFYKIHTSMGEILGNVSGKMQHSAFERADYPAVGDWVIIDRIDPNTGNAVIHSILPRRSKFSRKIAGNQAGEQIVAVNVDYLFICMSLNNDFNLRRLERYLIMGWDSGANPVIVLTKADLHEDEEYINSKIEEIQAVAFGVDVCVVSSVSGKGIDKVRQYLGVGKTVAFLGSSGVGKSTLTNSLLGEEKQYTKEIRDDDSKGKHATTHRELIPLKDGGIVIDTPGMREFHIFDSEEGLDSTFKDIEELAKNCKFRDCTHGSEPGCAVREAIETGTLSAKRYDNYLKLQKELEFIKRKNNTKKRLEQKNQMKQRVKNNRNKKKGCM